jgi:hypothetical protein
MSNIQGDLTVLRTLNTGRRANQGAFTQALVGALTLDVNAYSWYNLTMASPQNVTLPDATTLTLGWQVTINNNDSTNAATVKNAGAVTVKSIIASRCYRFTCTDISSANGIWQITYLDQSDLVQAERYSTTFNATTDWGAPAGGYYTWIITQAVHLMGTNTNVIVEQVDGSDYDIVFCDNVKILANGDVSLRVTQIPDGRFAGRITLV